MQPFMDSAKQEEAHACLSLVPQDPSSYTNTIQTQSHTDTTGLPLFQRQERHKIGKRMKCHGTWLHKHNSKYMDKGKEIDCSGRKPLPTQAMQQVAK
jgi:hypothetical protein